MFGPVPTELNFDRFEARIASEFCCYVFYWNVEPQSVGACSRRTGKKSQPQLLRNLAQAHALQSLARLCPICARAQSRVLSHRREVRRLDQRSDRKSRAASSRTSSSSPIRKSRTQAQQKTRTEGVSDERASAGSHGNGLSSATAFRLGWSGTIESQVHLRRIRHRRRQPVCSRRRARGRGTSLESVQPAVPLRRRRDGQDPPHAGHRARDQEARPGNVHLLRVQRELHQRDDQRAALQQDDRLPRQVSQHGCTAGRRHPVPGSQGAHPGGVLPHLQRVA